MVLILHFTELPLCKDTEDITVPPVVTYVSYWIVPKDATTARVGSPSVISAADMYSSIPVLTVILLTLQLWNFFLSCWMLCWPELLLKFKNYYLHMTVNAIYNHLFSFIFILSSTKCWVFMFNVHYITLERILFYLFSVYNIAIAQRNVFCWMHWLSSFPYQNCYFSSKELC